MKTRSARRPLPAPLLLLAVLGLAWSLFAAAQETRSAGGNPHGPLSIGCEQCHTPEGWRPLREPLPFDHGKQAGFPLIQGHKGVSCTGCHGDLRFAHVASACADCHQDVHRGAQGFHCERCHSPRGWDDRRRIQEIHAASLLPLTGAHATLDCEACHRGAPPVELSATPTECVSCHREDYQRAQPDHVRLGFPLACEQCHDTSDFQGASFREHDQRFFPIFSGPHRGVWDTCAECHPGNTLQTFTCLTCHEHRRSEMDDEHDDVRGYRYESTACLTCHPTGRE
jgi:hypothetical protein